MKQTIDFSLYESAFRDMGRWDSYSYDAHKAIFEYFDELGDDLGEEIELDPVAICCDVEEMDWDELVSYYSLPTHLDMKPWPDGTYTEDEREMIADWLQENTAVITTTDKGAVFFVF